MFVRVSVYVCSVRRNRLTARFPHSGSKAQWLRTLVSHMYSLQRAPTSGETTSVGACARMRSATASRSTDGRARRLHHESASQASEFKQDRQKETVHRAAFLFVVVVYALDRRRIHPRLQLRPWSRQHKGSRKYGSDKKVLRGLSVMLENFVCIKSAVLVSILQAPWKTWAVHFINAHHLLLFQNRAGVRLNFVVHISCSHP